MRMTEKQVQSFIDFASVFLAMEKLTSRQIICLLFDGESNDIITTVDDHITLAALDNCAASYRGKAHPDNHSVANFAQLMIEKLDKKRAEGRDGWDDPAKCSINKLYSEYTVKVDTNPEDFLDVAILAMMLHFRTQEA